MISICSLLASFLAAHSFVLRESSVLTVSRGKPPPTTFQVPPERCHRKYCTFLLESNTAAKPGSHCHNKGNSAGGTQFGTKDFWDLCSDNNIQGNLDQILLALQHREDAVEINQRNAYDDDGSTLLHYASLQGVTEIVEACLKAAPDDADPNLATFTYESVPLKWAAYKGYTDIVDLLVTHEADLTRRDVFGYTPLQYACLGGSPTSVSILLGIQIENNLDAANDNQLIEDITKLLALFSKDENVNAQDEETGFAPLHLACSMGRIDIVRALLELGANADEPNKEGRTPLFFAAGCGHPDIIDLLLEWGAYLHVTTNIMKSNYHIATPGWTLLHEACEKNRGSCAQLLLRKGVDVNVGNAGQETPLMIAAQHGHLEIAKLLLTRGAAASQGDDWNNTPLHVAARQNHTDIVRLLLEVTKAKDGDDSINFVNAKNNYNETSLHQACWLGRKDIAQYLLEDGGADIEAENKDEQSPMDYARDRGHADLVAMLKTYHNS